MEYYTRKGFVLHEFRRMMETVARYPLLPTAGHMDDSPIFSEKSAENVYMVDCCVYMVDDIIGRWICNPLNYLLFSSITKSCNPSSIASVPRLSYNNSNSYITTSADQIC